MSMLLVLGECRIIGTEPDGDTIHFVPTNPLAFDKLKDAPVEVKNGIARLRLEGIDALETHYDRTGPRIRQPAEFGDRAAQELLTFLGFTDVQRIGQKVVSANPPQTPAWVLTQGGDPFKRCVALLGTGTPPGADGTEVQVDTPLLQTTVNHHLLKTGLVYPGFYDKLFRNLREELAAVTRQAREAGLGLWPLDTTTTPGGAPITGMPSLTEVVILPKLFRRLVDHFNLVEQSLTCFPAYLAGKEDNVEILSTRTKQLSLAPLVQIINDTAVRMTAQPEDTVYAEG
ncbi:thermonuclease family protein [Streptomyces sp. NRRL B-24484]|uniref:thermonuclease family protein n=1 Tax=Streptomyces sp. NRRL B-24484 TaxID=1463833 RepID=UPI0004C292C4|nr:thermonuclease family protein [Streptomyces sp. NRRL B-24484]